MARVAEELQNKLMVQETDSTVTVGTLERAAARIRQSFEKQLLQQVLKKKIAG